MSPDPESLALSRLEEIVRDSFITEVKALKPGNVSYYAAGHGMTCEDFIASAQLVTPVLCNRTLSLGQRILDSVKITRERVGQNTNLGMLLLFAPIIMAAETGERSVAALQDHLRAIIAHTDKQDASRVFQAIALANPGGLGKNVRHDVTDSPDCGLLEAMAEVRDRDTIARQYLTEFHEVFHTGLPTIKDYTSRWNSVEWAATACFLEFLSTLPDSHIGRKYGAREAGRITNKAATVAGIFTSIDRPELALEALLEFDRELKSIHINPGTSADLTAASILVYKLINQ